MESFAGRTLTHYQVLEKLGQGGMGIVYKARDTRLNRLVALKVLPPDKTADPVRRARFMHEAQTASALNHPNIITIYEIDRDAECDFIVMELVPGRTLDLTRERSLKLAVTLRYAIQVADALAAAHAAGIVHRDLKPANVMVTESGVVKVLDFGLAKLTEPAAANGDATQTLSAPGAPLTEQGAIVGTVAYMSPEQAEGRRVDSRSDIFSFGSLLYEMLCGHRAFQRDTKMSTLSAILREDPKALSEAGVTVPRDLEKIVTRCLRKDPARRFQHMDDVKVALEELKEESDSGRLTETMSGSVPAIPARSSKRRAWVACAVLTAICLFAVIGWRVLTTRPAPVAQAPSVPVPLTAYNGWEDDPAFSPDGSQLAFSWDGPKVDNQDIYIKLIGPGEPLRLTRDPADDVAPSWSPDGRWIAFVRSVSRKSSIMLVPALGGAERALVKEVAGTSTAWSPDSRWVITSVCESIGEPHHIALISVDRGEKRALTSPPPSYSDHQGVLSPDGRLLAFVRRQGVAQSQLYTLSLSTDLRPQGEPALINAPSKSLSKPRWTSDGRRIVFSAITTGGVYLWTVDPASSAPATRMPWTEGARNVDIASRTSRLAYAKAFYNSDIFRVPLRRGEASVAPVALAGSTYSEINPGYSPDGKRIVFVSDQSGDMEIWAADAEGTNPIQLTFHKAYTGTPRWSPDGRSIAYDSTVSGRAEVYVIRDDGGDQRQVTKGKTAAAVPAWSPDGKALYFRSSDSGRHEIWRIPVQGGASEQVTRNGAMFGLASPDGKYLYFTKAMVDSVLWRLSLENSHEERVLENVFFRSYALGATGIWYIVNSGGSEYELKFLTYVSGGEPKTISKLKTPPSLGLSVSTDEQWAIFPQTVREGSDLMLIEGFR